MTINTFLPMRNKFAYAWSRKILAVGFKELLESIFWILLVMKVFSVQKCCQDALSIGSQLVRDQINMADEAKLRSPVHWTFEALVVWLVVRHCHGELGPFWPMTNAGCRHCSFQCIWLICWVYLSETTTGFTRIQKAVADQISSRPPDSDHELCVFVCVCPSLAFGSALEFPFGPATELVWLSYKMHFSLHGSIG